MKELRAFEDVAAKLGALAHAGSDSSDAADAAYTALERLEKLLTTTRCWDKQLALLPFVQRSFPRQTLFRAEPSNAVVTGVADALFAVLQRRETPIATTKRALDCLVLLGKNAGVREHLVRETPLAADALVALILKSPEVETLATEALCQLAPNSNVNAQHAGFWSDLLRHSITAISQKSQGYRIHLSLLAKVSAHQELKNEVKRNPDVKRFYRELVKFLNDSDFNLVLSALFILTNLISDDDLGEKLFNENNNLRTFELIFNLLLNKTNVDSIVSQYDPSRAKLALLAVELFDCMIRIPTMQAQLPQLDEFLSYLRGICNISDASSAWVMKLLSTIVRQFPSNEQIQEIIEESDVLGRTVRAAEATLRRGQTFTALDDILDVMQMVLAARTNVSANLEKSVKVLASLFHHLLASDAETPPVGLFEITRFFMQIDKQRAHSMNISHNQPIFSYLEANILSLFSVSELSRYDALATVWLYTLATREETLDELVIDNPFVMEVIYTVLLSSVIVTTEGQKGFRGILWDALGIIEWLCAHRREKFAEVVNEVNNNRDELFSDDRQGQPGTSFGQESRPDSSFERNDSKLDFRYENQNVVSMIPVVVEPLHSRIVEMSAPVRSFDFSLLEEELEKIDENVAAQAVQSTKESEFLETIENYKSDIEVFKSEIAALRGTEDESRSKIEALEAANEVVEREKQELIRQNEAYENEVHGMSEQLNNYERIVKTYESETQEYNEIIETYDRKAKELQAVIEQNEAQIAEVKSELEKSRSHAIELQEAKHTLELEVDDLRDREIGMQSELGRLTEYAAEIEENLAAEAQALQYSEKKCDNLFQEHTDAIARKDAHIEGIGGKINQLEETVRTQNEALRKEAERAVALEQEVQHYKSIMNQVMSGLSLFQKKQDDSADHSSRPILDRTFGL